MYSQQNKSVVRISENNFVPEDREVSHVEISPDLACIACLCGDKTLILKRFGDASGEYELQNVKRFLWNNKVQLQSNGIKSNNIITVDNGNNLIVHSIELNKGFELLPQCCIQQNSLTATFTDFNIDYGAQSDVEVVSFPRSDLIMMIVNSEVFAVLQLQPNADIQLISHFVPENATLSKHFYHFDLLSNAVFVLANDKSAIYGYSALTAEKTHTISLNTLHIENHIEIFNLTSNLKTAFLCDCNSVIHIIPTSDSSHPKSASKFKFIVSKLNPQKQSINAKDGGEVMADTLGLYFNGKTVVSIDVTLLMVIVCQVDQQQFMISYYDCHTMKLKNTFTFNHDSIFISGMNKSHPPVVLTENGVFMLPADKLSDATINKLMVFGDVAAAESLAHINNMEYISMPMNVLHLGLNFHQLDTISFFLKAREEALEKQLNIDIKHSENSEDLDSEELSKMIESENQNNATVMKLLICKIKANLHEGKSRQFAEKLLQLSVQHVTHIIMCTSSVAETDHSQYPLYMKLANKVCMQAMQHLKELRGYQIESLQLMSHIHAKDKPASNEDNSQEDKLSFASMFPIEWSNMEFEDVLKDGLLNGNVPLLQAYATSKLSDHDKVNMHEFIQFKANDIVMEYLKCENMQNARTTLFNAGLNANNRLKEILYETFDQKLRDFIAKDLKQIGMLSDEEFKALDFIHKMEKIHPNEQFSSILSSSEQSNLHMLANDKSSPDGDNANDKYMSISLALVMAADDRRRDFMYIHSVLNNCEKRDELLQDVDAESYWAYLLEHANIDELLQWIRIDCTQQNNDAQVFPYGHSISLPMVDLVSSSQSVAMQQIILDQLARHGMFCSSERQQFHLLLARLSKFGGLKDINSIFSHKMAVMSVESFHNSLIKYCLSLNLVNLLWEYVDFYGLSADLVINASDQAPKWTDMFQSFHTWNCLRNDQSKMVKASIFSCNYLLESSNQSIEQLFMPILSTIMSMPQQLFKITNAGEDYGLIKADEFKLASKNYPYLYSSLYPDDCDFKDEVNLYKLLDDNCIVNTKHLFNWQITEHNKSQDVNAEFPHFSNKTMADKFGQTEELSVAYYLKNGRPCFAFSKFLNQSVNLTGSVSKRKVESVCDLAHLMAFDNYSSQLVTAGCVAFIEMLGHDSLFLRVTLEVVQLIHKWRLSLNIFHNRKQEVIDTLELKEMLRDIQNSRHALLEYLEEAIVHELDSNNSSRTSVDAMMKWNIAILFCIVHKLHKSVVFLRHCAEDNNWLMFLTFVQIHQYPKDLVKSMINNFPNQHLKEHLQNTLQHMHTHKRSVKVHSPEHRNVRDKLYDKIGLTGATAAAPSISTNQGNSGSISRISESVDYVETQTVTNFSSISSSESVFVNQADSPMDFVSVIMKCHRLEHPWKHLINYTFELNNPAYCIIAASYQDACKFSCLCSWLFSSFPSSKDLNLEYAGTSWKCDPFKTLLKIYIRNGYFNMLLLAFEIFYPSSPLCHLIKLFKLIVNDCHLSVPGHIMKSYESAMIDLSITTSDMMESRTLIENISIELINQVLRNCHSSTMQLVIVSCLISDNFVLLFNEQDLPDYQKMKQILACLTNTQEKVNFSALLDNKQDEFQVAIEETVKRLLDRNLHYQAKQLCAASNFPLDVVIVNQVEHKLQISSAKENWCESETRIKFWCEAYEIFERHSISKSSRLSFFKQNMQKSACANECYHILKLMLKCFDSSSTNNQDNDEYTTLTHRMWYNKVVAEVETPYLEGLKEQHLGPVSDFMCTKLDDMDVVYQFEDTQYFLAIERVIGHELNYGRIKQALHISSIFNYKPQDLEIVMACIKLAKGESDPDGLSPHIKTLLKGSGKSKITRKISIATLSRRHSTSSSSLQSSDSDMTGKSSGDAVVLPSQAEVTDIICKLKSMCVDAISCCDRVLTYFQVSMALQVSYEAVIKEIQHESDIYNLLRRLLVTNCEGRFMLVKELISVHQLAADNLNNFLLMEILKCLHSYFGTGVQEDVLNSSDELIFNPSDNVGSFMQTVNLSPDPCTLGRMLLDQIDALENNSIIPESKCFNICWPNSQMAKVELRYYCLKVELCVRSHECYTLACNMEGISRVLKKARQITSDLECKEEYSLIIRLLTGIGRYSEMNYIFDLLKKHDKFELLFRKGMEKVQNLKVALLEYLKRFHPNDIENYNMVALHFSMFREIAEMLESNANSKIDKLKNVETVDGAYSRKELQYIVQYYADAAESYVKADCLRHAACCTAKAQLVALQIYLGEKIIIGLTSRQVIDFIRNHDNFLEAEIVSRAYENDHEWSAALFDQFVVNDNKKYMNDMHNNMGISLEIIEDVEKWYCKAVEKTETMTKNMKCLMEFMTDIVEHYKLAQRLGFQDVIAKLMSSDGACLLKDLISCDALSSNC